MRKLILSTIVALMTGVALVNAGQRSVSLPQGPSGDVATYDYAGVSIATITFSSANCQLFIGDGVVYGFIASSNTSIDDYVSFRRSTGILTGFTNAGQVATSGDYTATEEIARVYLSTAASTQGDRLVIGNKGMSYKFPAPIRVKHGCAAKASVGTVGIITYLYHKFGKDGNELP